MIIFLVSMYRDGGTIELLTDKGILCVDDRINTTTRGQVYRGYPEEGNVNLIADQQIIKELIAEALKDDSISGQDRRNVMFLLSKHAGK